MRAGSECVGRLEQQIRALCVSAPYLPPERREWTQEEVERLGDAYYRLTGEYYDITKYQGEKR